MKNVNTSPINTDRELIDFLLYNFSERQKNKVYCLMVSKRVIFNAQNIRVCAQFVLDRIDEQQFADGLENFVKKVTCEACNDVGTVTVDRGDVTTTYPCDECCPHDDRENGHCLDCGDVKSGE